MIGKSIQSLAMLLLADKPRSRHGLKVVAAAVLCLSGIIVYANTFNSPFYLDDIPTITDNMAIRNIAHWRAIWDFLPTRFLTFLSLSLNYHLHGFRPFGYHLFNLTVHLGATLLVWRVMLLTFQTPAMRGSKISGYAGSLSLGAGLLFAVHPVQTQGVTYIIQRAASMATLFYLGSLALYIKARLSRDAKKLSLVYYTGSLIVAVLAMFTKEITITLPLAVLLYDFCFLRTEEKFNWKYLGPFLLLLAIIPITVMKAKIQAPGVDSALEPGVVVPSAREYLLTEFRVIVTYIRLLFVPLHQNLDYDYPISYSLWNFPTLASLFLLTTIVGTAVKIFKSYRMPAFGIFWFFLTLIPESSVMPIYDVIFEHRLYLAMFGFAIVFVSGMYYFLGKRRPQAALVLALLILFAYGVLSIRRNAIWNNTLALWDDTLKKSPHKVRPHNNRGNAYADLGDYKKAIDDYNAALKLNPFHANSYFNRGLAFYRLKKYDAAIIDYGQAIMINPACTAAFNNRGSVYFVQGDYTSAIADYQEALRINPGYKDAYDNLAMASQAMVQSAQSSRAPADFYAQAQSLVLSGEYDKAIEAYTQAIKVNPKNAQAYNNRGAVFALKGWYDKAIADYTQALAIQPSFKDAQANLAAALAEQGQQDSGRKK